MQENKFERELELGLQELEAMEAPDFWSGFKEGATISLGSIALYSAISVAT
ncbi:daptide-type RiPP [Streptomyces chrestomyceticus]|uniref:daptide-type RiPP n=1 Tax=Streptomyces chrestomyceticus TaxID=68185 RepID=UPI0033E16850